MGKLQPGTILKTDDSSLATVKSSKTHHGDFTVYNFEVARMHNYFVSSANGGPIVNVHNCNILGGLGADDIAAINQQFSDGVPMHGKDISTVLANAFYRDGEINQAASTIRDIAEGHLFNN